MSFFEVIYDQMTKGNFSFAILIVGIVAVIAAIVIGVIQIKIMRRSREAVMKVDKDISVKIDKALTSKNIYDFIAGCEGCRYCDMHNENLCTECIEYELDKLVAFKEDNNDSTSN